MSNSIKIHMAGVAVISFFIAPFLWFPIALALMGYDLAPWPALALAGSTLVVIGSWFYLHNKDIPWGLIAWDIFGTGIFAACLLGTGSDISPETIVFFASVIYIFSIFQVAIHAIFMLTCFIGPALIEEENSKKA